MHGLARQCGLFVSRSPARDYACEATRLQLSKAKWLFSRSDFAFVFPAARLSQTRSPVLFPFAPFSPFSFFPLLRSLPPSRQGEPHRPGAPLLRKAVKHFGETAASFRPNYRTVFPDLECLAGNPVSGPACQRYTLLTRFASDPCHAPLYLARRRRGRQPSA